MSLLADSTKFLTLALNDVAPVNGMYVLYTRTNSDSVPAVATSANVPVSFVTSGGITTSGASLDALKEHVSLQGDSMGLARITNATPNSLFVTVTKTSGGYVTSSGWTSAGGSYTITSGATTTFYATTANAEHVCGLPLSAGCYARASLLAHLDSCHVDKDTALDYNVISGGIVFPANGAITLIEKVTAN